MKPNLRIRWAIFRDEKPAPAACVLLLFVVNSYAQGVVFTDRPTFNAALQSVPPSTSINFESLSPSGPFSTGTSPITVSGMTITNAESQLFVCNPGSGGPYPIPGTGQYIWNFDSSYPIGIYLPSGKNAFGADFSGGISPNTTFNATLTVNLLGGQSYSYNFSGPVGSWTFFGVAFSQPISSLIYHDGGNFIPGTHEEMLDNVTFGTAIVPEPGNLPLLLGGLAVGVNRCRRRWR